MFASRTSILQRIPFVANRCLQGEDHLVLLQAVRWRKRRWAPKSLTKTYHVPERTPMDPIETEELRVRYSHYKTTMRAFRNFLFDERMKKKEATHTTAIIKQQAVAMEAIMAANRDFNAQSQRLREARVVEEEKRIEESNLQRLTRMEESEQRRLAAAERLIQSQQLAAGSFITMDNLDMAIEHALDTPVTHNFVIDKDGSVLTEESDGSLGTESIDDQLHKLMMDGGHGEEHTQESVEKS